MRTTVDLPPAVHHRALELAKQRGQSLSKMIAELTARGLGQLDEPLIVAVNPISGFPVITLGRAITSADVAEALDEE